MEFQLNTDWKDVLIDEFEKDYFLQLQTFISIEYKQFQDAVFPEKSYIFNAFNQCAFKDVKVVILGQDPYPTKGHANGLSFSVNPTVFPFPKSLINIFKEIEDDLCIGTPKNGDLSRWAKQGVLLLNSILTVREGKPQSHQNKGWEKFTDAVIQSISTNKQNVVFLLWGNYAKHKGKTIDVSKHLVLESGHPSPMSANRGLWFGNKHFSQTNEYLIQNNLKPIDW